MPTNFDKNTCDRCGITKEKHDIKYPWSPYAWARHKYASFRLGQDGSVLCGLCASEKQLEELFALMDARDKKFKEKGSFDENT